MNIFDNVMFCKFPKVTNLFLASEFILRFTTCYKTCGEHLTFWHSKFKKIFITRSLLGVFIISLNFENKSINLTAIRSESWTQIRCLQNIWNSQGEGSTKGISKLELKFCASIKAFSCIYIVLIFWCEW